MPKNTIFIANDDLVNIVTPTVDDVDEFIHNAEESQEFLSPWVKTPMNENDYNNYILRINGESNDGFLVRKTDTNNQVGVININNIIRGSFQSGFLGFYCFEKYSKQGLMSCALQLVIKHAFEVLKLHRLEANIQPNNHASVQLVIRNGFRKEGYSPRYLMINDVWCDHERYVLTVEDWQGE